MTTLHPSGVHFVSFPEAALRLGCGRTTVYGYVTSGDLHPIHHGRRSVLAVVELDALASRLARAAGVELDLLSPAAQESA